MILTVAVGLVLLIACGNVASLLLAHGSTRRAELSLRAALGASRPRLVRQLLTESVLLGLVSGMIGTALAVWFQELIATFLPMGVPGMSDLGFPAPVLALALAMAIGTGVLFGVVPALRGARVDLVQELKSGARGGDTFSTRFRSGLVMSQVALALILLTGSGLLIRSLVTLSRVETGFDTENLLTAEIRLSPARYTEAGPVIRFYTSLLESLRATPGVIDAAVINQLPIRDAGNNLLVHAADSPPDDQSDQMWAFNRAVLPGYFEAMKIPLLAGRDIESTDRDGAPLALVINETMAETLFPDRNPLGREVVVFMGQSITFEVVGVVGDVRMSNLYSTPRMAMYASFMQIPRLTMRVAIRTGGDPRSVAGALRRAVWDLDRDTPVAKLSTMEDVIAGTMSGPRVLATTFTLFAAVALSLAAIGLYGLLAYYVSVRAHEIAVRVALGAGAAAVVRLILRRGFLLVAAGIAIGLAVAAGVTRVIESLLYGVEPIDPVTFASASLFFVFAALVACLIPALRALRVDPATALHAE